MKVMLEVIFLLNICKRFIDLDFDQLCRVFDCDYEQSNKLYDYLIYDFFRGENAIYAIWISGGEYVSALRLEPFEDGYLLEALQTVKEHRRKGYAKSLISGVLNYMCGTNALPIYVHINKRNKASMEVHYACGFRPYLQFAKLIDGTVTGNACTLKWP